VNAAILVINAGSSSVKFSLFNPAETGEMTLIDHGQITGIGTEPRFVVKNAQGQPLNRQDLPKTAQHKDAFWVMLEWLEQAGLQLAAVGHRIVHGGGTFTAPVRVTPTVVEQLEQLIPLAPLHQPHNIAPIKILNQLKPELPQVACFDNAFHNTQPAVARHFAIPRSLTANGIKRYGFHGLSYEYIAQVLPHFTGEMPKRVIVAHLGNGVSLCALSEGQSIATTMGFTPLDGVPMGTRPGTIDAGVLLHLLNHGMDVAALTRLLYYESGLLGISGISNDMQTLLASEAKEAKEAIDLFVYRIGREIGSLAAALEGLDALVFTAGIGQYATLIRTQICQHARWLGICLDETANQRHGPKISTADSHITVWVIPTDEEKMIAQHTHTLLANS